MLVQHTEIFKVVKREIAIFLIFYSKHRLWVHVRTASPRRFLRVQNENCFFFLIFAQNIDCGFTLEPPRPGDYYEYPQSIFWSKYKKNRYTPAYPSFAI